MDMVRTSQPDRQQSLDFDVAPKCPLCGRAARPFGRGKSVVWTCTGPDCHVEFTPIVEPSPKPRGGAN